jgi:quinol monooxygenase YgiN
MIHVLATVDLAPGTRDAFLKEFRAILSDVRAEKGCLQYGPTVDVDTGIPAQGKIGPDRVLIIEQWESVDALKAHLVAPHMQAYRPRVKDYVKGMELRVVSPT